MANYSRWNDVKQRRPAPTPEMRAEVEHDLALGQLIYDLRTAAGLSQRELAERMGTTQSVISRLEEGGGASRSPRRSLPSSRTPSRSPDRIPKRTDGSPPLRAQRCSAFARSLLCGTCGV